MSIASEIQRIQGNIADAYTSCSNKGATMPVTQDSANLSSTIDTITTGGGGDTPPDWKDVNFIDYDGTLLHSYTLTELQALTSLPSLPSHTGLTCQEWNWTLADLKTENKPMIVGATYKTSTDGTSKINIVIEDTIDKKMVLRFCNGTSGTTTTINWGDGSANDSCTVTSATNFTHEYSNAGNYTITLTGQGTAKFKVAGSTGNSFFGQGTSDMWKYGKKVKSVFFGTNLGTLGNYGFHSACNLESIVLPKTATITGSSLFYNCYSLKSVVFPSGVTGLATSCFYYCRGLEYISIPKTVTSTANNTFRDCTSLKVVTLPNSVTTMGSYFCSNTYTLKQATMSNSVTALPQYCFYNCYALRKVKLSTGATSSSTYCVNSPYALTELTVPSGLTVIPNNFITDSYSLESITFLGKVTSIGNTFLTNAYGLLKIDFTHCTSVPTLGTSILSNVSSNYKIVVPDSLYSTWTTTSGWSTYASHIVKESEA